MTSENCTYLVQASTTTAPTVDPCNYRICKCSSDICRVRFDFNVRKCFNYSYYEKASKLFILFKSFVIADPFQGTGAATTTGFGGSIGDCLTDTFSITSPGNNGSPLICGTNSGQHSKIKKISFYLQKLEICIWLFK